MTISSTVRIAGPYTGNGVTTSFTFAFKVFSAADVYVVRLDITTGFETVLVLNTDYTVSLNANQNSNPGGSVVAVTAPLSNQKITITSDLANLQPTDLTNQGGFFPTVINDALDRSTIQLQQLAEDLDRSIKVPLSSTADTVLPLPEANSVLGWNNTATAPVNIPIANLITVAGSSGFSTQTFSGTGSTANFVLSAQPGTISNLELFVSGVRQTPTIDYSVSGSTLTFVVAPPVGTDNILARWGQTLGIGVPSDGSVTTAKLAVGAVGYLNMVNSGLELDSTNYFYNPFFLVDQRSFGATHTITAGGARSYGIDRWGVSCTGANVTAQRINFGALYYYGITGAAGNTGVRFSQRIEAKDCLELLEGPSCLLSSVFTVPAGKTVTYSIYTANAVDNFATKTLRLSGSYTPPFGDWYSIPFSASSITNFSNGIEVEFSVTSLLSGESWEIYAMGLRRGTSFTPIRRRYYSHELALCQRYYWTSYSPSGFNFPIVSGIATAGSQAAYTNIPFPVTMRSTPVCTRVGTWTLTNAAAQPAVYSNNLNGMAISISSSAAGAFSAVPGGTGTYLTADAEL